MSTRPLRLVAAVVVGVVACVVSLTLGATGVDAQVTSSGSVSAFGDATSYGSPAASQLAAPISAMAPTPDGRGYWLLGADGGVFAYGDAPFFGSKAGAGVQTPFVGIAATPDGKGYWVAGDFGNVYGFGDAPDEGYLGVRPAAPVIGIAADPTGSGYWLVGADGGVFSLGPAFYGSMGGSPLAAPVVGMAPTPDGRGYWLVAADGGVFSFGDAAFYGSMGASPPSTTTPVVAMAPAPGGGYLLTTTDKQLPPATAVPSVMDQCTLSSSPPAVEPGSIVLACGDGNASLTHLSWSSWTATSAAGTGEYTHNTCTPDCAQGSFVSTPASVRLGYPIETSAGREFAQISYTYADPSAPGGYTTDTFVAPTNAG